MNLNDVAVRIENKTYTPSDIAWLVAELRAVTQMKNDFADLVSSSYDTGYLDGKAGIDWKIYGNDASTIWFGRYQDESARTLPPSATKTDILIAAIGLCGESGEVADYIKKIEGHGHECNKAKLAEELGDVLWYVAALCSYYGIQMGAAAIGNIKKLRARYPKGFSQAASRERTNEL
jgi:NTP pyrophosphatase (non-canonical NTP hydrolase)